ncbi:MAG: hypothetical protein BIP78_0930 [Candidatus Bipolaricaulis sibiricus]|uniref:Uncharacterized protein n=1 Tax=Bipolaricaulis sibiricus TaxID=2501609 RepID=A0A410FUF2_BIPS1|nr:MAG: hypothetical protein BIP78_0930 [Candidatus Bipolaricaulis sibiricus]
MPDRRGFQSTPPCGGRLPRLHSSISPTEVSIHAPVRGATSVMRSGRRWSRSSFNPRPRAGGDHGLCEDLCDPRSFNPRPRAGGDWRVLVRWIGRISFNPRPRAGGDPHGRKCR